jgi:hypothetical protein
MARTHPDLSWCRYADDGLVHCRNEQEAQALKSELQARLAECRLEMHPTKTKIVYCQDTKRTSKYPNVKFDFLGYCFRPRLVRRFRDNSLFCGFNPAVSSSAMKAMRSTIREFETSPSNTAVVAGNRPATQSTPAGLDRVLRAIRPIVAVPHTATRQSDARSLGDAQVQAL